MVLNEKDTEPMTICKGGSVDMELVGSRVENESETSFPGNKGVALEEMVLNETDSEPMMTSMGSPLDVELVGSRVETESENSFSGDKGVAIEIQEKEERDLNEKDSEPLTTCKGGLVDMEFVASTLESQSEITFSRNKAAALVMQEKEERVLNEKHTKSMTTFKGGSVDMELVASTLESENETSFSGNKGVALEEERVLNGKDSEPVTIFKEGSAVLELVGNRPESEKEISLSGNNGNRVSQSAAGRGETLVNENGQTNQDFSAIQKHIFKQMHQTVAVQNARVQCSVTSTELKLLNFGALHEPLSNVRMDLHISSGHTVRTMDDPEQRRREKRKQSNRESAKRSRFRKQQECERLRENAEKLNSEIISELPNELRRLSEECEKLDEENTALLDEMEEMYGPSAVADLRAVKVNSSDSGSNIEAQTPSIHNSISPPRETRLFGVSLRANVADC